MDELYDNAKDEQLVLLIRRNHVPAYYSLFMKCLRYANIPAKEIQKNYPTPIYDEGEYNECVSDSFRAALYSYDFSSSLFKNYFIRLFRHCYSKAIKKRSEREFKLHSINEYLTPHSDLTYEDVLAIEEKDLFHEYYELFSNKEMLSSLKTSTHLSPKIKAMIIYRCRGYSNQKIARLLKLSIYQVRHILSHPKLKRVILKLIDELKQILI